MNKARYFSAALHISLFSLVANACFAISKYVVTDVSAIVAPSALVTPNDINDLNQIVGVVALTNGTRGFVLSDGQLTLLQPLPNSNYSTAAAINSIGQIVGSSDDLGIPKAAFWLAATALPEALDTGGGPDANVYGTNINDDTTITGFFTSSGGGGVSNWTAVKWQPDSGHPDRFDFTKLNTPVLPPPGVPAGAFGVNAAGEIVGSGAIDPTQPFEGALRWNAADQVTPLDTLDGVFTLYYKAVAINASSVAVGRYRTTTGAEHAVKWNADGSIVTLNTPAGFTETNALDINNDGIIVGKARAAANQAALIYADGAWVDLNSRLLDSGSWQLETAVAINNQGAIVGTGTLNGAPRAFVLSPITVCPGDYNVDGTVNAADYVIWRDTLGQTGAGLPADGDHNGTIDSGDYSMWKTNFGSVGTGSLALSLVEAATAPEPAALSLLMSAALTATWLAALRRRPQP